MNPFAVFKPTHPFQVHRIDLSGMTRLEVALIVRAELAAARAAVLSPRASRPS